MDMLKTLQTLVDDLQSTTSSNKKIEILETYSEIEDIKNILVQVYSPYIHFGVSSKNCIKLEHLKTDHPHDNIFNLLRRLADRTFTGHEAIKMVNGFVSANRQHAKLIYNILDKDLKTRTGASLINKAIPGLVPQFKVALAQTFEKAPDFENEDWYVSQKLDGVRCLAINIDGDIKFYSRQGNEFETLGNLKEDLIGGPFDMMEPNTVLDGEVCIVDENGSEDFQSIMKEIRRKDHTIENPMFIIFDQLTLDEFNSQKSTRTLMQRNANQMSGNHFQCIEHIKLNDTEELLEAQNVADECGYEGIMLRRDCGYEGKRSKNLLKVKKFHDAEYTVKSCDFENHRIIRDGKEVLMPMLAQIYITHKGNEVGVGSGFSQEQRIKYQLNPEEIIGKTVTVQYFEESQNKAGDYSLRFPVLKHIYEGERNC